MNAKIPRTTVPDDQFGLCPQCMEVGDHGAEQLWRNVGRDHYVCCDKHNCYWLVGSNLFSAWRDEPKELHLENRAKLDAMDQVQPRYYPEKEVLERILEVETQHLVSLYSGLSYDKRRLLLCLLQEMARVDILPNGEVRQRAVDLPF